MVREKTIEKIVREFIAKELTMSPEKINLEDNLVNDLHADSMDIVNIVTAIESRFKITFPDDSEIQYDGYTMQFLVEGIKKALKEKNPVRKAAKKLEDDVEAKKQMHKATKAEAPKAKKTSEKPAKKAAEKPVETKKED